MEQPLKDLINDPENLYKNVREYVFAIIENQGYQNSDLNKPKYFNEKSELLNNLESTTENGYPIEMVSALAIRTELVSFLFNDFIDIQIGLAILTQFNTVEKLISFVAGSITYMIIQPEDNS